MGNYNKGFGTNQLKTRSLQPDNAQTGPVLPTALNDLTQTILNIAPLGVYVVDKDLRFCELNPYALSTFGDTPDLIGRDFNEFIHTVWPKDYADEIVQLFRYTLESGEPYVITEQLHERLDRKVIEGYDWQLNRIRLPNGDYGVVCYFRDVTECALAHRKLRESEERYRKLFNSSEEGFCVIEVIFDENEKPIDYCFLEVNPTFEKQTGLHNAKGKRVREIVPEHEAHWFEVYGKVALTGEPIHFINEARALRRWFDVYAWRDGEPDSRKVAIVFSDITERRQAKKALRESEERYRNLFNSIDEGFCVIEMIFDENEKPIDYCFLEVNPTFEKQTGLHNAKGKRAYELVPNIEAHWFEVYGKVALTGEPIRFVNEVKALNRWFDIYACRVGGPDSHKVAVVFSDITERKQAVETLAKSHAQLQSHAEQLTRFNRVAVGRELRIIELKREVNLLLQRLDEVPRYPLDFEQNNKTLSGYPELAPDSEPVTTMPAGDNPVSLESILRTEELTRRPSRLPDYKTESRVLGSLTQAMADSPLTILQALADAILETLHVHSAGISLLSKDEKSFYWPAIAGMWQPYTGGVAPRDASPSGDVFDRNAPLLFTHFERRYPYLLTNTPPSDECLIVPFYLKGKAVGTLWAIIHEGSPREHKFDAEDLRQLESLGQFAAAAYQASAASEDIELRNEVVRQSHAALNLMEDALETRQAMESLNTELSKAVAAAEKASLAKSAFLSSMSHELRTPLTAIIGFAQLLENGPPPPSTAQSQSLEQILAAGWHLLNLINEILDLSLIESGRLTFFMDAVPLTEVVLECQSMIQAQAQHRGIEITFPQFKTLYWVEADRTRLKQILINLLSNAIKYNKEKGSVTVSCHAEKERIRICIEDTGIGISPEKIAQLFQPFNRLGQENSSQEGTGIGLVVCKRLVELMGGTIGVESTPGKGSTFWIELKVVSEPKPVPSLSMNS
jgi:PAS domain S-box-containing protein